MTDPNPPVPSIADIGEESEPEAWLIREIRGSKVTVMAGQIFKREDAARAAALRLTNGWRLCQAFPVVSMAAIRSLKDRVASPSDGAMEDEAARKLVDALIAKTWRWGHGCAVDDIHDMPTIGDSYNEGGREESTKLGNSLVSIFSEMSASHKAMRTSRDRTRAALEKMRASDPAAGVTAEQLWNEAARGRTFSITQTCYQTAIAAIEAALALRPQPDLRAGKMRVQPAPASEALNFVIQQRNEALGRVEQLELTLQQIEQWCAAYPIEMFPEPDLNAVGSLLANNGMRGQLDRMHASWARHIMTGIREIADRALSDGAEE